MVKEMGFRYNLGVFVVALGSFGIIALAFAFLATHNLVCVWLMLPCLSGPGLGGLICDTDKESETGADEPW